MALSITVQVSNAQTISWYHGPKLPYFHGVLFCFVLPCFNFSSTYFWFVGEIGRSRDLCHWGKGMGTIQVQPSHFSSLSLSFSRRWQVAPLRLLCREGARFFLTYHIHFHQLSFWIYFPIDPRVELQTIKNSYPNKRANLYGKKKSRFIYLTGQEKYWVELTCELFTAFLFAKIKQIFHLHQIYSRSFNCLL